MGLAIAQATDRAFGCLARRGARDRRSRAVRRRLAGQSGGGRSMLLGACSRSFFPTGPTSLPAMRPTETRWRCEAATRGVGSRGWRSSSMARRRPRPKWSWRRCVTTDARSSWLDELWQRHRTGGAPFTTRLVYAQAAECAGPDGGRWHGGAWSPTSGPTRLKSWPRFAKPSPDRITLRRGASSPGRSSPRRRRGDGGSSGVSG